MEGRYNVRSPAVKRLMKEAQELSEPTDQYYAQPLEDNLFEWHFTVRGPADSDFQNGIYHGRIILPVDYPMKPPSIIWLTPNGRFETNKKICLSISGHHPESWQPSWSIRTALLAIIGFMPTHPGGAIGSLDYKPDERKVLAKKSRLWKCPTCDDISNILLEPNAESQTMSKEAQELAAQIQFQGEKPKGQTKSATDSKDTHDKKKDGDPKPEAASGATPATSTQGELPTSSHQQPQTVPATSSTTPLSEVTNNNGGSMPATSTFNNIGYPASSMPASSPSMFHAPPLWGGGPPVYCGQTSPYGLLSTPRFPYPPSYYPSPSFYPPGYAMAPGMGMVPCPFPPPYQPLPSGNNAPPSTVSINNSSVPSSDPCKRPDSTSVTYTRSPMSCSTSVMCRSRNGDATGESSAPSTYQPDDADKAERKVVLGELLNKVKRVGSDDSQGGADVDNGLDQATKLGKQEFQSDQISTNVDGEITVREGRPDIDASAPLNRRVSCGDVTISEAALPSDIENSEADAPPMEVSDSEQRSFLDKSKTCNSTSELEKCKAKHPPSKTLRQRQSATASVVTEAADEGQADPSVTASGQRIEAESGDSGGPRMRPRPRAGGIRLIHSLPPRDGVQRNAQAGRSPYDFTVLLMVVCLLTIVGILFNRLFGMYTATDIPTSSPSV